MGVEGCLWLVGVLVLADGRRMGRKPPSPLFDFDRIQRGEGRERVNIARDAREGWGREKDTCTFHSYPYHDNPNTVISWLLNIHSHASIPGNFFHALAALERKFRFFTILGPALPSGQGTYHDTHIHTPHV
eukprot:1229276-Amorphochlora_amoeboformis.AAC.2